MNLQHSLSLVTVIAMAFASHAADFQATVNDLIPRLADANVPSRYAAQMELQDIAANASKPGSETDRAALSRVLAAKAADAAVPQPARVWIVLQLQHIGAAEAVPALTTVLNGSDPELRECARRALEKNPAPEASNSLWAALEKVATDQDAEALRWKIGLMNSLAERRDTAAVGLIVARLRDAGTADAAALALGRMANAPAVEALWSVFPQNRFAGEALIEAANRLGRQQAAADICQRLYALAGDSALRSAALVTLAQADAAAAAKLIPTALAGNDTRLQLAALTAAATAHGSQLSQTLAPLLPKLAPAAKARLLALLDAAAEPQVIATVADSDEAVRRAALEALGRIGSRAAVPVLLNAATEDAKPGKPTATTALARIHGPGAAEAIRQAASSGEPPLRAAAINALAARRDVGVLPTLLSCAGDASPTVRKAAFAALGTLGTDTELEPLARMAISTQAPEASAALAAVAARVTDKPAAARKLLSTAGKAEAALASVLDALSAVGGSDALAIVTTLTRSADQQIREDALRALGEWADFGAVKPLQSLAANSDTPLNLYALAMQGIARLVKMSEAEPAQNRIEAAQAALAVARRDDEKKLMLSALGSVPDARAAAAIMPLLEDANLKREAGAAALTLAEALRLTDRKTSRELAQAVKKAAISTSLSERADRLLNR
jgi:HEAT repeat protein